MMILPPVICVQNEFRDVYVNHDVVLQSLDLEIVLKLFSPSLPAAT